MPRGNGCRAVSGRTRRSVALTRNAVIVDAVRTPMGKGKEGGALSSVHPVDLLATVLKAVAARNAIDPALVGNVIVGCVTQSGEQANVARMAVLSAGFPVHVPATMIDRKCGSSQQAVHFAAQGIAAGAYDIVIAGGVESMSRVPMGSNRMRMDDHGPGVYARFAPGPVSQGVSELTVAPNSAPSQAVPMIATPVGKVPMTDRNRLGSIATPCIASVISAACDS
jgi:acetyl-CoA acetyltransferase